MTKHQRPAEFEQPRQMLCRVAELATRFGAAEKHWDRLDAEAESTNDLIMTALREAAVFDQPTSPIGALFQVLLAAAAADDMQSFLPDDAPRVARDHAIRVDCALWGVRNFLEAHFGISAATIGGLSLMTKDLSHLGRLAVARAAAEAERASGPQLLVA